ncbi:PEP-CTERM sorting domain-containing protein [Simiduia curdlanivorans]|uniref:PEP-CTERM sorting domain-containing protein n=1 Tax=Simiduia curdlanivorans TaxID=1492769 RepID=A0ABV8V245_9GAMM|nr:PEP-CTERM sorting domain-containing protein [Simiduia curdlanivorans]MDN3637846.1 PEP-CTERM sorting domain-containing protein [Simiduia curdlanivorans]
MRHLLITLLVVHSLARADVIDSTDDTLGVSSATQQPLRGIVAEAVATNSAAVKPLFWLSILPVQDPLLAQQSLPASANPLPLSSQYWQPTESQVPWPLPEPGTLLLFGAGILLVFVARHVRFANQRRKSRRQTRTD